MTREIDAKKVGVGISPKDWVSIPRDLIDELGFVSELDLHTIRGSDGKLKSLVLKRVGEKR